MHHFLAWLMLLLPGAWAVFMDEAYTVDYHYSLLGLPKPSDSFFQRPAPETKASLLYTASERDVLGAVNPRDGTLVWRKLLAVNESTYPSILRPVPGHDTIISAAGGSVASWVASDGRLAWDQAFPGFEVSSLEILEGTAVSVAPADAIALLRGPVNDVIRLDGRSGNLIWQFQDDSGDNPFRVAASTKSVFYISHQTSMLKGNKMKVTTIDATSGKKVDQHSLNFDADLSSPSDTTFVCGSCVAPFIAWVDDARSSLKFNILGTKAIAAFDIEASSSDIKIDVKAVQSTTCPSHFLVHFQSNDGYWAEVYHIDAKASTVKKAYTIPRATGRAAFSASLADNRIIFTRVSELEIALMSSIAPEVLQKWAVDEITVNGDERLYPVSATTEVVTRSASSFAVRAAVLLSNGEWTMIQNGQKTWSRPEALAKIIKLRWAEITAEQKLAEELKIEANSNIVQAYIHRLSRHFKTLSELPARAQSIPDLILSQIPGFETAQLATSTGVDRFGFHKLIVAATDTGRLIALDVGDLGRILWNVKGASLDPGQKWAPSEVGNIAERVAAAGKFVSVLEVALSTNAVGETGDLSPLSFKSQGNSVLGFRGAQPVWTFTPGTGEHIACVSAAHQDEPVASLGKVMGDRTVLYKYLNPNTALVITVREADAVLSVYLLDSTIGSVLYSTTHNDVDSTRPITSVVSENWFTYSFTTQPKAELSRGYHIVMAELYASAIPNDRGNLEANISSNTRRSHSPPHKPHVFSQTYHIPEEISHMSVTQTLQGITSRFLLVTLANSNALVSIPNFILDPRRPVGKDPTPEQQMEGLSRYAPFIDFDPSWHLSHREEVMGLEHILTTPALLESTSLVFAYGLDLFGTRITPSFAFDMLGKSFNYVQLVLTVFGLFVGTLVVAPFIQRKQTNALWTVP